MKSSLTKAETEQLKFVKRMIAFIGDDPTRPGLLETPSRVVKSWRELFSGYKDSPKNYKKIFQEDVDQMIVLRGCEFFSMCEHHMLPFYGTISIGYIPNGKLIGLSKLARIANCYSRRLQVQERMTEQIAKSIMDLIDPLGVAVVVEGVHTCMTMRGVNKQRSRMTTSCMLGIFRKDPSARSEVLSLLRERGDNE